LDATDIKILNILKENARESASVIAGNVHLSVSAVIERVKKLELTGIIKKYTTVLDYEAAGLDVVAFMDVTLEHPRYNADFIEYVIRNGSVIQCHYIAGDYDFLLKIATGSITALENILNGIKSIQGVGKTVTTIVLSTLKEVYTADLPYSKK